MAQFLLFKAFSWVPKCLKTLTQNTNSGTIRVRTFIWPKWVLKNETTWNKNYLQAFFWVTWDFPYTTGCSCIRHPGWIEKWLCHFMMVDENPNGKPLLLISKVSPLVAVLSTLLGTLHTTYFGNPAHMTIQNFFYLLLLRSRNWTWLQNQPLIFSIIMILC